MGESAGGCLAVDNLSLSRIAMTLIVKLGLAFFFASSVAADNFDLGGFLSQGKSLLNQVKGDDGGLNITGIGNLLSQATGVELGGIVKEVQRGEGLSLDTVLGVIKRDQNGNSNVANILGKFGYTVKDVVQKVGLGKNEHVATIAEQFITDPTNLDASKIVTLCEALETAEEKPQIGDKLAMLGMTTATVGCPSSARASNEMKFVGNNLALILITLLFSMLY